MAKAQVGDLIRITKVPEGWEKRKVGDIVEVTAVFKKGEKGASNDGVEFIKDGMGENVVSLIVYDDQYEIHRKAGEEDSIVPAKATLHSREKVLSRTDADAMLDAVNPQHYKQGRTEVIDIIEDAVAGAEPFEAVCQANVLKYTLRYRHKNGVEDLKKAVWYAEKLIDHLTQK